jgi:hypothetical protein
MIIFILMAAIAWGMTMQTGFNRREAQTDLIEEWQQKGNPADAETSEEAAAHGGPKGTNAE